MQTAEIEELIDRTYRSFEIGNFSQARQLLNSAHSIDGANEEIQNAMRACGFWNQRQLNLNNINGGRARGDYLQHQWIVFEQWHRKDNDASPSKKGHRVLESWVHREVLDCYRKEIRETNDIETVFQLARCLKIMGHYDEAIERFEYLVNTLKQGNPRYIAELADAYMLVGEVDSGKILMREALFIDASQVEWNQFIAPLFKQLVIRMRDEIPVNTPAFQEWLPVYGFAWFVLNTKRKLSSLEYEELEKKIGNLKSELSDGDINGDLTPKLINCYFRLYDHHQLSGVGQSFIERSLMSIKPLSPQFYDKYIN